MNYRNPKLLKLAKEVPVCLLCGKHNDGDVVACHSEQLRDGFGKGIKSHDYRIAYMCGECHFNTSESIEFNREEKHELWEQGHRESIGWLFENGHLEMK